MSIMVALKIGLAFCIAFIPIYISLTQHICKNQRDIV